MYKYLIITKYLLYHIYIILGNPTRLAPIPKPAPPLALEAIDGTNTSRMEKLTRNQAAQLLLSLLQETLIPFLDMLSYHTHTLQS